MNKKRANKKYDLNKGKIIGAQSGGDGEKEVAFLGA